MRIAINSPNFLPRIGGLENVTAMLAGYFARQGHEVRVLTSTAAEPGSEPELGFEIIRDPQGNRLWETARWCHVFVHSNMSLKAIHPLILLRKPWLAVHHGWYSYPDRPITLNAIIKCQAARLATANVAVSQAVADYVGAPRCTVIHNPYDDAVFKLLPGVSRDHDLLFVGRLVSDKAPRLLLEAAGRLRQEGLRPSITITGSGPEDDRLRRQTKILGLESRVRFTGALTGGELAKEMNRHRILVVPSTIWEGFGIVAVEGIACGCVVVGSDKGGLPEAIGPCGETFESGSPGSLAAKLRALLAANDLEARFGRQRNEHLSRHSLAFVGGRYLSIIMAAASKY